MRFRLEYVLVSAVERGIRIMPMPMVRACGTVLGVIAYALDRSRRRVALDNLAQAFPMRRRSDRRAIARRMFMHFGRLVLEMMKFSTLTHEQMRAHSEIEGEDRVAQAHVKGHGVLFFTGHFGYWEVQAIAHPLRVAPIGVIARPLDNPFLHTMLERMRTKTGNHVIYRDRAIRRVLRALAINQGVALLIDQHLHSADAVYVDFFHRPAATTSALASLALRTGATVIPVFALPLPRGRYRFVYESPVPPPSDDSPDAIREFTQRCTDVLEMYVRRDPSLWLWMHRRWRPRDPALAEPRVTLDNAGVDA
jgi:KDO2-lipid IV(A) lauroyltransferase